MKKIVFGLVVLAVVGAIIATNAVRPKSGKNADSASHSLTISGAWALYPVAVKWAEAFQKSHPGVQINVTAGGAGKGMADALSGTVDIGMVSREVDAVEKEKGAFPTFITRDGVFPVVSEKNVALPAILSKGVTREKLAGIYIGGKQVAWSEIAGDNAAAVHAYTRSDACGAASAWAATLGKYKQDDLKGTGIYGDPGLLEAVRRDPLGIGYNNLGYVFNGNTPTPGIKIVPIDANGNGKVDTDELIDTREKAYAQISSGKYPGARREFLVTKGKPAGLAKEFIEFALSPGGTKILEEVGGYVPLAESERAAELSKIR